MGYFIYINNSVCALLSGAAEIPPKKKQKVPTRTLIKVDVYVFALAEVGVNHLQHVRVVELLQNLEFSVLVPLVLQHFLYSDDLPRFFDLRAIDYSERSGPDHLLGNVGKLRGIDGIHRG